MPSGLELGANTTWGEPTATVCDRATVQQRKMSKKLVNRIEMVFIVPLVLLVPKLATELNSALVNF